MAAVMSLEINNTMQSRDHIEDSMSPTTPRANAALMMQLPPSPSPQIRNSDQMLPIDPALEAETSSGRQQEPFPSIAASNTTQPQTALRPDSQPQEVEHGQQESWAAMDLDGSEAEQDGSDNDTENGDPDASTRKKKGQRFFCTGYPPCSLSFTRSEHLARHIRKHTGERPFQCHCNRRFSRLDNLRQHAQTVHVNEEIPTDSLAATGTRFQRQIRTDRVRPAGRPRTSTMSSTGSLGRGHSRNTSTSSIGSTSSNISASTESRRRPPPLAMATDPSGRPKLGIDPPSTPPPQHRGYADYSPGGQSTPTSTAYPATPGSPSFGSSMGSPISTASRMSAVYGSHTPARRLSVPTGTSPFHAAYANTYPSPYMNQMGPPLNMSSASSMYASPTSANFPAGPGYQVSPAEDWRRRTWHPSTYYGSGHNYARPATSGLTYSQTPDAPQPAYAQNANAAIPQAPRLPGIESFDHMQHRPCTPPRRQLSPMQVDGVPQHPHPPFGVDARSIGVQDYRPGHVSWDGVRPSAYPPLDQHQASANSTTWGQQTISELQHVGSRKEIHSQQARMGPPPVVTLQHPQQIAQEALSLQPPTPTRNKRHGWYNGPLTATRTSPEDSSSSEGIPTPGTSATEVHPAIVHSNGYIEPHHVIPSNDGQPGICSPARSNIDYSSQRTSTNRSPKFTEQRGGHSELSGLDALVAVATSEETATASAR